jgi:metaxin
MPSRLPEDGAVEDSSQPPSAFQKQTRLVQDLFAIPLPVKKLFDRVPLVTYPPNQLPQRTPKSSRIPSLYVFSTEHDAAAGRPSFNLSCLKWQVSASPEQRGPPA